MFLVMKCECVYRVGNHHKLSKYWNSDERNSQPSKVVRRKIDWQSNEPASSLELPAEEHLSATIENAAAGCYYEQGDAKYY